MKGKDKVTTIFGGIVTAIIMLLTLGYFLLGFQELVAGDDPVINNNTVHNYYSAEKGLNLYDSNHSIAISVVGNGNIPKYDKRYVRLIALYYDSNLDGDV